MGAFEMRTIAYAASAILAGSASSPAFAEVQPYVGAIVGWDHVVLSSPIGAGTKDGVIYGGMLGVDYVMAGGPVLGLEGEINGASTSESITDGSATARLKAGRDFYAGARFGMVVAPHVLAYAKGGYTNARATLSYRDPTINISESANLDGWRVGGGAELAMRRARVRLEYRYSNYGEFHYQGINTRINAERHQVVLGALLDL